jgi:bile acid:Na+ symporter, BASS family
VKVIKLFEEHFWLPITISLVLGLLLPAAGKHLNFLVIPFFMVIFFLTCLKINFLDVVSHIKRPLFIIYILLFYLVFIPAIFFAIVHIFNPEIAIGILLLTSMPPGTVSPVFTDIVKGNTTLSMAIALASYVVSPFTIVFLFYFLTRTTIHIDLLKLFQTLLLVNFFPLLLAEVVRKTNNLYVEKTKKYYSFITICCIGIVIYIVVAAQANEIIQNPFTALIETLWLYLLFIILYLVGYIIILRKKKEDRIAIAVTKTYMNNALAISIAAAFFSPKIALLMVLSEIPFGTTLGIFKYLQKYLR